MRALLSDVLAFVTTIGVVVGIIFIFKLQIEREKKYIQNKKERAKNGI